MNNPHTDHLIGNGEIDFAVAFNKLGDYCESIWESDDLSATEKADLIRTAAYRLLSGENEAEDNAPHGGGIPDSRTLESDARLLTGSNIIPRKMSKAELQAAADRLTGGRSEDDVIESAINKRLARRLMSHPSNF